jgi:hypothetical protein
LELADPFEQGSSAPLQLASLESELDRQDGNLPKFPVKSSVFDRTSEALAHKP